MPLRFGCWPNPCYIVFSYAIAKEAAVFFTRLELMMVIGVGGVFVALGLATLILGQNEAATTMLLAGLAVLGIYLWMARSEA